MLRPPLCLTLDRLQCEPAPQHASQRHPLGPIILTIEQSLESIKSGVQPVIYIEALTQPTLDSDQDWI